MLRQSPNQPVPYTSESIAQEAANLMQDKTLRKEFGSRIKEMRKLKKWTQKDLAAKLGVQFGQVNKYESGLHIPPIEKLVELAEVFDTTIDYLITGNHTDARPLHSQRLIERFQAIQAFDADDQETVIKLIDAMIVKRRVEGALQVDRKAG